MAVDDEKDVVFCLSKVLQETGLFDFDIRMPKMDGFELYRNIKLLDRNVDVCFLTAVNDFNEYRVVHRDITDEIEKDDDSCIIDKPADTEQLIKRINKVLVQSPPAS